MDDVSRPARQCPRVPSSPTRGCPQRSAPTAASPYKSRRAMSGRGISEVPNTTSPRLRWWWDHVVQDGEHMERVAGENEEMPDRVVERQSLPGEEDDARRVTETPREQEADTAERHVCQHGLNGEEYRPAHAEVGPGGLLT
jgi:hypothetical protein